MFSKTSIKRPVTTVMLLLMVILVGILAYMGLDLALMPSIDVPVALVHTTYIGAGPSEIENLVTKPVEEALGTVSNVEKITSVSSANTSMVMVQFVDGTDIDMSAVDMREKLDLVKGSLPEDSSEPVVLKIDMNAIPVFVGVTSENLDLTQLNNLLEESITPKLERIEGVSAVNLSGGLENEIEITLNPEKMEGYGITANQLSQALSTENMNMPSGNIYQGESQLQLRTIGEFSSVDDIRNLPITTPAGGLLYLRDVADVHETTKDRNSFTFVNGTEGIMISLDKQSTANIVDVSNKINAELEKLQKEYPEIKIHMLSDTADYIKDSIGNVTSTAFQSALVAVIVLFLFLRNPITSLIIGISIPTSILATFALMYLKGLTMNIISMGGISLGIGMLVDNSIVVLDNIFKYWERGASPKEAAQKGSAEISMAVTASTLTTIAVFLPLVFVKGSVGQMLQNLAYTICFALSASLVVSLTFVPMACSILLYRGEQKALKSFKALNMVLVKWGYFIHMMDEHYRKVLVWTLRHRKRTVAIVLAFFIFTLALTPLAGFDFMPKMDQGSATITVELPKGTTLEVTEDAVHEVLARLEGIPELDLIYASVGSGMIATGTDSATVTVNLVDKKDRKRSTDEVCVEIKEKLADVPGVETTVSSADNAMGSFGGSDISLNITGYDMDLLHQTETDVKEILKNTKGLKDVSGSSDETVPEAWVAVNRSKASQYGISTASLAATLNTAVSGTVSTQYKVNGDEIDVRIRYDKDNLNYINDVKNLTVTSPSGLSVPLSEVADIEIVESAVQIFRENQKKYVTVEANTDGIDSNTARKLVDEKLKDYAFPDGCSYSYSGTLEQMQKSFKSLLLVFIVAVLLIYMIMASQFESLIYPGIVMFSMPLAITGGILGLVITGNTITVVAFMGFIMLVGIVVNNAIVLVDYTNQLMAKGKPCDEALIEAGPSRLRPILMTTLTTILGMLPIAFGTAEGIEMQKSMAITVIFGLTVSTLITLIFIPVLYSGVNDVKRKIHKKRRLKKDKNLSLSAD